MIHGNVIHRDTTGCQSPPAPPPQPPTYDVFAADELTRDAVIRNIEIIGEAAAELPKEIAARARQSFRNPQRVRPRRWGQSASDGKGLRALV